MIARGAFLSLLVLAVSLWVENGHSQAQGDPNVQGENSAHSNPSDVFSIPVRIIPSPAANENDAADAKAREESNRREDENLAIQRSVADSSKEVAHYSFFQTWIGAISLILSFATVAASGFAAWFAFGAVREARQSTQIAQRALAVTEQTTKSQLRAYVTVSACKTRYVHHEDTSSEFQFMIMLRNQGQTPATDVRMWSTCQAASQFDERFKAHDGSTGGTRAPIGPTGEMKIEYGTLQRRISQSTIDKVRQGLTTLWIDGHVQYDDIFGETHTTNFRFYITNPTTDQPILSISEQGNEIT